MDNKTIVKLLVGASITGLAACAVPTGPDAKDAKDAPNGSRFATTQDGSNDGFNDNFAALCCW
jgi:hypothetical protein